MGSWISTFYAVVDKAAVGHNIRKVETRGDCCICLADSNPADGYTQVDKALQFASTLNDSIKVVEELPEWGGQSAMVRIGMATGDCAMLIDNGLLRWNGDEIQESCTDSSFRCVHGNVVNIAARMEAVSAPGKVSACLDFQPLSLIFVFRDLRRAR